MREGRPGDQRGFVHKRILGGISKIAGFASAVGIPGAGTVSSIANIVRGGGGRRTPVRTATARVSGVSLQQRRDAAAIKFAPDPLPLTLPGQQFLTAPGSGPCADPRLVRAPDGHCVSPGSGHAARHGIGDVPGVGVPVGDAVMGRYGAALAPGSLIIDRAVCLKGMQLGDDGLCYNKSQITNKQRMWPAGRKPLLTGGDMRAISIAARAGRRVEGVTKRLQRLGMMKKPASRGRRSLAPPVHQRLLEAHVTK